MEDRASRAAGFGRVGERTATRGLKVAAAQAGVDPVRADVAAVRVAGRGRIVVDDDLAVRQAPVRAGESIRQLGVGEDIADPRARVLRVHPVDTGAAVDRFRLAGALVRDVVAGTERDDVGGRPAGDDVVARRRRRSCPCRALPAMRSLPSPPDEPVDAGAAAKDVVAGAAADQVIAAAVGVQVVVAGAAVEQHVVAEARLDDEVVAGPSDPAGRRRRRRRSDRRPGPPSTRSLPLPPLSRSAPGPPLRRSFAEPPRSVSRPPRPISVSLPNDPLSASAPEPPRSVSAPRPPFSERALTAGGTSEQRSRRGARAGGASDLIGMRPARARAPPASAAQRAPA